MSKVSSKYMSKYHFRSDICSYFNSLDEDDCLFMYERLGHSSF